MNVLLVRPPATFYPGTVKPLISLPVGLLSIAALLERESYQVSVYDAQLNVTLPVVIADEYVMMGDSWGAIETKLRSSSATIIGISFSFSSQLENARKLAELARECHPDALIVAGGPHASAMPVKLLDENPSVDIVCIGEGEYTMLELVCAVATGGDVSSIPGTVARSDGMTKINQHRPPIRNLDELPFPAYHLVDLDSYFSLFRAGFADRPLSGHCNDFRAVSVITSRGCPFNCVFCSIHLHMGKQWRGNSVHYLIEHIKLLIDTYGVKHIHFEDDNISFNRSRFVEIVAKLKLLGISWDTPNGIRVDTLTEELVNACKESGCTYLILGVESGSQQILDTVIDKRLNLLDVVKVSDWCRKAKLDAMAFYVVGFPGETRSDMFETVNFALDLMTKFDVTPHLFVATPLPGTRLEKMCMDAGYLNAPLSSAELSMMTQGNFSMAGGTFEIRDLTDVRDYFFSKYRRKFIFKAMLYLISSPVALVRLLSILRNKCSNMTFKECFISIFQTKHSSLESL